MQEENFRLQFSDLASPAFYENPYPLYEKIRAAKGLVPLAPKIWATGKYQLCDELSRDRRMGRNYMGGIRMRYGDEVAQAPIFSACAKMMLLVNPPDHTRLKNLLLRSFTPNHSDGFRQLAADTSNQLLDAAMQRRSFDLVEDYALPLPLQVICRLMDAPFDGALSIGSTVGKLAQSLELAPMTLQQLEASNEALAELNAFFRPILESRRRSPGKDLISQLLATHEGEELSEDELLANIMMLFIAGHETTSNMIGNALLALHQHPDQRARLMDDPGLLPNFVTEALRYDGSVQQTSRSALEDMHIDGTPVARGDVVFLLLGAANRDPARFHQPDRFLIDRPAEEMRPLTFGGGIHHCLGARLAMIELETALGHLIQRMPDMRITNLNDLRRHPRHSLRGVQSLQVAW